MTDRIRREDLQSAIQDLVGAGEETVTGAARTAAGTAAGATILVLTLAFLVGRRKGRRSKAVVEVRRI